MRVSISPKGSLIAILAVLLPARLDHAGDLAGGCEVAQCDARQLELAVIRAGPARQLATVAHPDRRGIPRHLGKLCPGREPPLGRPLAIGGDSPRPGDLFGLEHERGAGWERVGVYVE